MTPALFVAAGLGMLGVVSGAERLSALPAGAGPPAVWAPPPSLPPGAVGIYPAEMVSDERPSHQWLVDGFNVVSVGLLGERGEGTAEGRPRRSRQGWWRREHREALVRRARGFDDPSAEVWIVFDGDDARGDRRDPPIQTVFSPSADDWLLARVRRSRAPERLTVVTADRRLAGRIRSRGVRVVSPADFLARCRS